MEVLAILCVAALALPVVAVFIGLFTDSPPRKGK